MSAPHHSQPLPSLLAEGRRCPGRPHCPPVSPGGGATNFPVAQLAEPAAHNGLVAGSSPAGDTSLRGHASWRRPWKDGNVRAESSVRRRPRKTFFSRGARQIPQGEASRVKWGDAPSHGTNLRGRCPARRGDAASLQGLGTRFATGPRKTPFAIPERAAALTAWKEPWSPVTKMGDEAAAAMPEPKPGRTRLRLRVTSASSGLTTSKAGRAGRSGGRPGTALFPRIGLDRHRQGIQGVCQDISAGGDQRQELGHRFGLLPQSRRPLAVAARLVEVSCGQGIEQVPAERSRAPTRQYCHVALRLVSHQLTAPPGTTWLSI